MRDVCQRCERRAWLLQKLGVRLDFRTREPACLWSLLELSDRDLIDAVGGRHRSELHEAYGAWTSAIQRTDLEIERICVHHDAYPACLRGDALAPRTLGVRGGHERLNRMLAQKVVAVVGTRRATDYGMELARELARGLATCGLTVVGGLGEGIAGAVQRGVLDAGATPIAVIAGSLERCSPAWCEPLYRRVVEQGCAISEQQPPSGTRSRSWWGPAADRTLALLAELTIVVEAGEHPRELACARVAWTRAKHVAALPGRVTSPASAGCNSLLMNGARLVRGTQDALDALYGVEGRPPVEQPLETLPLEPRLAQVLADVGRGKDTLARLTDGETKPGELALVLAELECKGLLVRGDAGRYIPRHPQALSR